MDHITAEGAKGRGWTVEKYHQYTENYKAWARACWQLLVNRYEHEQEKVARLELDLYEAKKAAQEAEERAAKAEAAAMDRDLAASIYTVNDLKAVLISENSGHEVTFKIEKR